MPGASHIIKGSVNICVIKWKTCYDRVTARPNTRGHLRSAGSWECPGLSLSSVQVCLHSGVISELNYFGQPQLCCDWFLTCHQLFIIYCSKTHSKPAVGLINQDSQGAGVGGVQSAQSRNQDTGVLALLTQYLGPAIQPTYCSVCSSVKWAQPSSPQVTAEATREEARFSLLHMVTPSPGASPESADRTMPLQQYRAQSCVFWVQILPLLLGSFGAR